MDVLWLLLKKNCGILWKNSPAGVYGRDSRERGYEWNPENQAGVYGINE